MTADDPPFHRERDPEADAPAPLARPAAQRGRGATYNPGNRFRDATREAVDDGWAPLAGGDEDEPPRLKTIVTIQASRTIIARNNSPDVGFDQSINPYQGCEHGCIYCYARPSHAYFDLSPGLDFETKLFAKPNAAELLRAELANPRYQCEPIHIGGNTDPYQPIEREWKVTRSVIEVLSELEHPFTIITKNALIERDLDLLAPMAAKNLVRAAFSITTLDREIARTLEPRASAPERRLRAVRTLADAGIPVSVMVAPIIPQLNDKDLEAILERAAQSGARGAGWIMVRLPREVAPLFRAWLDEHFPQRAAHVMSLIRDLRGGKDYDSTFGERMRGSGNYADLIEQRFELACRRLGLNARREPLDCARFKPPAPRAKAGRNDAGGAQLDLFGSE